MKLFRFFLIFCGYFIFSNVARADLQFNEAKIFAPLKGSNSTAGYVIIKNNSKETVEVSLNTVEKFKIAETHETFEKDGRMSMKKVDSFKILAHENLELKPGGKHIMLFEPTTEIKLNSTLKVHFTANKKPIVVNFKVVSRAEK